jgi:hypothetical protein
MLTEIDSTEKPTVWEFRMSYNNNNAIDNIVAPWDRLVRL